MLGSLAIGKKLPKCSDEEIAAIRQWGSLYKEIRHITYHGDLYRLVSIYEKPYASFEYVSKDRSEALLFLFSHSFMYGKRLPAIRLKGLEPDAIYEMETYGAEPIADDDYHPRSGRALMEIGLQSDMLGDYRARIIRLKLTGKQK